MSSSSSSLLPSSVRITRSSIVEDQKFWQLALEFSALFTQIWEAKTIPFICLSKLGISYTLFVQSTQTSPAKNVPPFPPELQFWYSYYLCILSLQSLPKLWYPSNPSPTLTCQQTNTPMILIKIFSLFLSTLCCCFNQIVSIVSVNYS